MSPDVLAETPDRVEGHEELPSVRFRDDLAVQNRVLLETRDGPEAPRDAQVTREQPTSITIGPEPVALAVRFFGGEPALAAEHGEVSSLQRSRPRSRRVASLKIFSGRPVGARRFMLARRAVQVGEALG